MAVELEASRLLVHQAAAAHDRNDADSGLKSSMVKRFATQVAQRIVDQALQIHGGTGAVAGQIMEQLYRDVLPFGFMRGHPRFKSC